jgi:hypothetical protein
MTAWSLSDKEWDPLDRPRFSISDAAVLRNSMSILMEGRTRMVTRRLEWQTGIQRHVNYGADEPKGARSSGLPASGPAPRCVSWYARWVATQALLGL